MRTSHATTSESIPSPIERLQGLLDDRRHDAVADDFRAFEERVHSLVGEIEREIIANELSRYDINEPAVVVDGVVHRFVLRSTKTYMSRAGEVSIERSLYRAAGAEKSICPMEMRAGIVEGYWTPWAAMLTVWALAHLTATETAEWFSRLGDMRPSRSTLERLPRALSTRWEKNREDFEVSIRAAEPVPDNAAIVAVSLDGVMVPMKEGGRQKKRAVAKANGKEPRGPAGYREASCGTISFYDRKGNRLSSRAIGRMPEKKKRALKASLREELLAVLAQRPDLLVVGVADGAKDNWEFLKRILPLGSMMVLDFFHAAEHLKRALDQAHGKASAKAMAEFERLRHILRHEEFGVKRIIGVLAYQVRKHPRRKKLARELNYFRRHSKKMDYAHLAARGIPLGSGVVEAANKTLVTVRMKRAGARWTIDGGQAILTFRALSKSQRFDRAWTLLAKTYTNHVEHDDKVIPIPTRWHGTPSV